MAATHSGRPPSSESLPSGSAPAAMPARGSAARARARRTSQRSPPLPSPRRHARRPSSSSVRTPRPFEPPRRLPMTTKFLAPVSSGSCPPFNKHADIPFGITGRGSDARASPVARARGARRRPPPAGPRAAERGRRTSADARGRRRAAAPRTSLARRGFQAPNNKLEWISREFRDRHWRQRETSISDRPSPRPCGARIDRVDIPRRLGAVRAARARPRSRGLFLHP